MLVEEILLLSPHVAQFGAGSCFAKPKDKVDTPRAARETPKKLESLMTSRNCWIKESWSSPYLLKPVVLCYSRKKHPDRGPFTKEPSLFLKFLTTFLEHFCLHKRLLAITSCCSLKGYCRVINEVLE